MSQVSDDGRPMLELKHISRAYGDVRAVIDADLDVALGEVVCLLGPSGCGKTTLLRVAAGLEHPDSGEVWIDGKRAADRSGGLPPESRSIGLVFQDFALFPHLNVADNVAFGMSKVPPGGRRKAVDTLLEQMGMAGSGTRFPHMLSGGQQQRVALARALAPKPHVMLLDEPFSGLDRQLREAVRDEALHHLKGSGAASLLVTHDAEEAMFMADRIAVMRAGRIIQVGGPDELYYRPATAFVASFLGDANVVRAKMQRGRPDLPLPLPGQAHGLGADTLPDGTEVDVIVRPEGLRLTPDTVADATEARVLASRFLGRTSLVHLSIPYRGNDRRPEDAAEAPPSNGAANDLHLHARVPGRYLPEEGAALSVTVDPQLAFVFRADHPI